MRAGGRPQRSARRPSAELPEIQQPARGRPGTHPGLCAPAEPVRSAPCPPSPTRSPRRRCSAAWTPAAIPWAASAWLHREHRCRTAAAGGAQHAVIGGLAADPLRPRKVYTDDLDVLLAAGDLARAHGEVRDGRAEGWALPDPPDRPHEQNEVFEVYHLLYQGSVVDLLSFRDAAFAAEILATAVPVPELSRIRFIRPELLLVTQLLRPGAMAAIAAAELTIAHAAPHDADPACPQALRPPRWAARKRSAARSRGRTAERNSRCQREPRPSPASCRPAPHHGISASPKPVLPAPARLRGRVLAACRVRLPPRPRLDRHPTRATSSPHLAPPSRRRCPAPGWWRAATAATLHPRGDVSRVRGQEHAGAAAASRLSCSAICPPD